MRDKQLYAQILGIASPWQVAEVELSVTEGQVTVFVERKAGAKHSCPHCGKVCAGYDKRRRRWRHLDTCQFKTLVEAEVGRVKCAEHGVVMEAVPWAETGSGFTALFEALVIDWLGEASISAVARQLGMSWNAIDAIMRRAVKRGLARRAEQPMRRLSIDETAFRKRHDYVTVISNEAGDVVHVAEDRKKASVEAFYEGLSEAQREGIESVTMDMWPAFIEASRAHVPGAAEKIAFDKFHVAKYLGDAVDKVRRSEHKALKQAEDNRLAGTKYNWLADPAHLEREQRRRLNALVSTSLKTARAWAIKEYGMSLWHYCSRTWAQKGWKRWYAWAIRSRLEPVKKVAKTIKRHLWGIINAVILKVDNAGAESINSRIKMVKMRSRGFRNKQRYRNAIYFHLGGLDLYPAGVKS